MHNLQVGAVIKQCRVTKGITQQKLCSGICSVSTLSRIENGTQIPSRSVFTFLMERLGEDKVLYEDYMCDNDYEARREAVKVMKCLERKDISTAHKHLDALHQVVGVSDESLGRADCIYRFTELLTASVEANVYIKSDESIEVNQYGYYLYEEVRTLLQAYSNLDRSDDGGQLDPIEIRMYNLMAYARFLQRDYHGTVDIWARLVEAYKMRDESDIAHPKEMASLYCNISATLSALEMYDEAVAYVDKGLALCFVGGGLRLVNRLLHNRMYTYLQCHNKNKAYTDLALAKGIGKCAGKDVLGGERIKSIPNYPLLIQVF